MQLSERTEAASAAEEKVKELEAKVAEQKILIVKLEEDILKVLINSLSLLPSTSAFTLWDLPYGLWPYCGYFQLYRRIWLLYRIGNRLIGLAVANSKIVISRFRIGLEKQNL